MIVLLLAALQPASSYGLVRDAPLTPGGWTYQVTPGGSEARFGNSFMVRCERGSRQVSLRSIEPIRTGPGGPVNISTDTMSRTLPASGVMAASDPLLDSLAYSRGRFVVDGGGASRLVLPASPEAARSIEDCRN